MVSEITNIIILRLRDTPNGVYYSDDGEFLYMLDVIEIFCPDERCYINVIEDILDDTQYIDYIRYPSSIKLNIHEIIEQLIKEFLSEKDYIIGDGYWNDDNYVLRDRDCYNEIYRRLTEYINTLKNSS